MIYQGHIVVLQWCKKVYQSYKQIILKNETLKFSLSFKSIRPGTFWSTYIKDGSGKKAWKIVESIMVLNDIIHKNLFFSSFNILF